MKPRVLLLHGVLSTSTVWGRLREHLREVDIELITPDLLGFGRGREPRGRYTLERVVADLEPLVHRESPSHLVGHSMGAIVALALAAQHPGRFEREGLVGLPIFHNRADGLRHLARRGRTYRTLLRTSRYNHAGCLGLWHTRGLWAPWVSARRRRHTPPEVLGAMFDHRQGSHSASLEIVFGGVVEGLAARVRQPVVCLHGARDRSAPAARVRVLAQERGWSFQLSEEAAHQVMIDDPHVARDWLVGSVLGEFPVPSSQFPVPS